MPIILDGTSGVVTPLNGALGATTPNTINTTGITFADATTQTTAAAYPTESDPIFFQWQRGQKTEQEWLDAVAAVHAQYPYK